MNLTVFTINGGILPIRKSTIVGINLYYEYSVKPQNNTD